MGSICMGMCQSRVMLPRVRWNKAKHHNIEWTLGEAGSPEEAAWVQRMKDTLQCPDCAGELVWTNTGGHASQNSGSFDRIDCNIGYHEGNVRLTCTQCNQRKSNSPVDEWVGLLEVRVKKGIIECVDPILKRHNDLLTR